MELGAPAGARGRKRVDRPWGRKALAATAPREAHEHRLGDVILLVPEPEHPDPAGGHLPPEELEARLSCLGLACQRAPITW